MLFTLVLRSRCFPEDLLLAVEALPWTIDALTEAPENHRASSSIDARGEDDSGMDTEEEEEEEDEQEVEEEEDDLDLLEVGYEAEGKDEEEGDGGDLSDRRIGEVAAATASPSEKVSETTTTTDYSATAQRTELEQPDNGSSDRPPPSSAAAGSSEKSWRKRLQRRRAGAGGTGNAGTSGASARGPSTGNIPRGGRGRRGSPPAGPSLTAPFLTWLLWLEHCRRASELETKSRAAARAFVVRAGSLAPILEACFRVLRASSQVRRTATAGCDPFAYLICLFGAVRWLACVPLFSVGHFVLH